jgi:phosphoglycolate phosphatase-like HAD superfamily hydrolase
MNNTRLAVIDLDGVCANSDARFALAKVGSRTDWSVAFDPANVPLDTLIDGVPEALAQLESQGYQLVYLTSRPESMRDATLAWLDQHDLINEHRPIIFKSASKQFTKTKIWKVEEVRALVERYNASELLFVDDEPVNVAEVLNSLDMPVIVQTYASLALALEAVSKVEEW